MGRIPSELTKRFFVACIRCEQFTGKGNDFDPSKPTTQYADAYHIRDAAI
jgi:hypothetical protein